MAYKDKTYLLKQNDELFQKTLDEFSSTSFDLASTNRIITNSNYNKGSFYHRFKTKEEIYIALINAAYVEEITLYRSFNTPLKELQSINAVIALYFEVKYRLFQTDPRYIQLEKRIYLESKQRYQEIIHQAMVSFDERVFTRIDEIIKDVQESSYIIWWLKSLFIGEMIDYHAKDFRKQVKRFIERLNHIPVPSKTASRLLDIDNLPEMDQLFLLANEEDVQFKTHQTRVSKYLLDTKGFQNLVRERLKIKQVSLENMIKVATKKSLRDLNYLHQLLGLSFAQTSYHKCSYIERLTMILIFLGVIGKDKIYLDYCIKPLAPEEVQLLFQTVLPITHKMSKIYIVDCFIYPVYTKSFIHMVFKRQSLTEIPYDTLINQMSDYQWQIVDSKHVHVKKGSLKDAMRDTTKKNTTLLQLTNITTISVDTVMIKEIDHE